MCYGVFVYLDRLSLFSQPNLTKHALGQLFVCSSLLAYFRVVMERVNPELDEFHINKGCTRPDKVFIFLFTKGQLGKTSEKNVYLLDIAHKLP